jgi:plastocyanin domain-containing protein
MIASRILLGAVVVLASCDKRKETSVAAPGGVVAITASESGFKPSSVTLEKGGPGKLVFTRTTDETCATEVVFPELNVKKELPKDKPVVVEIPTDKAQTITFQCGMGMYKSAVVIAEK